MAESSPILITGATGLIGKRLVARLLPLGVPLIVLSRRPHKAAELGNGLRVVSSLEELSSSLPLKAVIHLAGEPVAGKLWTEQRKRELKESRAELPRQIGDWLAAAEHPPEVVLSASAIGWYGTPRDPETEFTEESPSGSGFAAELCAHIETSAAQAVKAPVRLVHLRIGLVLATPAEGGYLAKLVTPVKLVVGATLGNGRQWQSWIHVDDTVNAIIHCMNESSINGPVNLTAPSPERAQTLMNALGSVLRRPVFLRVPGFLLRVVAGDMADDLLLASQRVIPGQLLASGFTFEYPELTQALDQLLSGSR